MTAVSAVTGSSQAVGETAQDLAFFLLNVMKRDVDAVNRTINLPVFKTFPTGQLAEILRSFFDESKDLCDKSQQIVRSLVKSERLDAKVLLEACEKGWNLVVDAFTGTELFRKLTAEEVRSCYQAAKNKGHQRVLDILQRSPRAQEVNRGQS